MVDETGLAGKAKPAGSKDEIDNDHTADSKSQTLLHSRPPHITGSMAPGNLTVFG